MWISWQAVLLDWQQDFTASPSQQLIHMFHSHAPFIRWKERGRKTVVLSAYKSDKLVDGAYKRSNLGIVLSNPECEMLPKNIDLDAYCEHWYGNVTPEPRPVYIFRLQQERFARRWWYNNSSRRKQRYDYAAADLGKSSKHSHRGKWHYRNWRSICNGTNCICIYNDSADGTSWNYCDSPAYNESGLAMYIEKEGLSWSEQEAPTSLYS